MTEQELREIEELEKAATAKPWRVDPNWISHVISDHGLLIGSDCRGDILSDEDAAFIARARQAVPALIAEVRKARGTEDKGSEMLACPHCTGKMQLCGTRQGDDFTHDSWWIECKECRARGPSEASSGDALRSFKAAHGILKQSQENTRAP